MKIVILSFAVVALLGAASQPTASISSVTESKIVTDFRPGQAFRDCPNCPEMVVVPAGNFTMGSPANERGRDDTEGPQRQVNIRQFAVGKFDVTRGQWAGFVSATNRKTASGCAWAGPLGEELDPKLSWRKLGFPQDDTHPVVCVTWGDAQGLRYVG
jgi:formylglycine-generating enzyme required for sulfatase activity